MIVRTATADDVPLLAALRRAWTEEIAGGPVADDGFEQAFADWHAREQHQRVTWLAEQAAANDDADAAVARVAVGMLNMLVFTRMPRPQAADASPHPDRWGYVANVYVVRAARDAGVGGQLLKAAVTFADDRSFARLVLSPSERSVPFYARAGFVPATSLMVRPPGR